MLRQLGLEDVDAAARVVRAAFDQALSSLAGLSIRPRKTNGSFRERVSETCEVWGAFDSAGMTGMIAFGRTGSTNCTCCQTRNGAASAQSCCKSPKVRSIAGSFGRSSAMRGPDVFTRLEALRWSSKQTTQEMRRSGRMRAISAPADRPTVGDHGRNGRHRRGPKLVLAPEHGPIKSLLNRVLGIQALAKHPNHRYVSANGDVDAS